MPRSNGATSDEPRDEARDGRRDEFVRRVSETVIRLSAGIIIPDIFFFCFSFFSPKREPAPARDATVTIRTRGGLRGGIRERSLREGHKTQRRTRERFTIAQRSNKGEASNK